MVCLQNSEEAREDLLEPRLHHSNLCTPPLAPACNRQPSLLCKEGIQVKKQQSMGPLLKVAKLPKCWEGLRGQSELAVTSVLPLRRDLFILLSAPWGPGNQYSPSKHVYPPIPSPAGLHTSVMGNFLPLDASFLLWQLWCLSVLPRWEEFLLVASIQWSQLCPLGPKTPCVLSARSPAEI